MNQRTTIFLAVCLLLIAGLVPAIAAAAPALDEPPLLPHAFYGAVQIIDLPAPVGVWIEARGPGVLTGVDGNPLIVSIAGHYGSKTLSEPRLVVQGDVAEDTPLAFYVNGIRAKVQRPNGEWQDTFPFESGALTELNLRTTTQRLYLPHVLR